MSPTALTIPVNVVTPTTAAPSPVAAPPVAADFMMLVQQMLGETQAPPVASMPVASETLQLATASEGDTEEERVNECAGLAALLALLPQAIGGAPISKGAGEASGGPVGVTDLIASRSFNGNAVSIETGVDAAEQLLADLTTGEPTTEVVDTDIASFAPTSPETTSAPHHRSAQAEAALSRPVHTPVGSTAWSDEIATRLTLMAEHGKQSASLRLSPEHLGPLEVRIAVNDDQASVWFGAAHADTRAAIEQALPRLRELFEAQGMSLTDAGVFKEPPREHPQGQVPPALNDDAASTEESVTITRARLGLVDAYA